MAIIAQVEVFIENRFVSDFMVAAGLGLSGVGERKYLEIEYKEGEVVDENRVMSAINKMIEDCEKKKEVFRISQPRFMGTYKKI